MINVPRIKFCLKTWCHLCMTGVNIIILRDIKCIFRLLFERKSISVRCVFKISCNFWNCQIYLKLCRDALPEYFNVIFCQNPVVIYFIIVIVENFCVFTTLVSFIVWWRCLVTLIGGLKYSALLIQNIQLAMILKCVCMYVHACSHMHVYMYDVYTHTHTPQIHRVLGGKMCFHIYKRGSLVVSFCVASFCFCFYACFPKNEPNCMR
jgi:hypothetical protein